MKPLGGITLGRPMAPPSGNYKWVYLWGWPIRAMHWAAVAAIVVLAVTGFYIGRPYFITGGEASSAATAAGLEVGTTAPDFRLKNQEQATVALSDYAGTKNVVLVFYPADFTPV